jgi:hypothetical protein
MKGTIMETIRTRAAAPPGLRMPHQSAGVNRGVSAGAALTGVGGVEAASILEDIFGPVGKFFHEEVGPYIPAYHLADTASDMLGL